MTTKDRLIKFRVFDTILNRMYHHFDFPDRYILTLDMTVFDMKATDEFGLGIGSPVHDRFVILQFTGLFDKNGKEVYEGDIFRVEEDTDDLIYYLVVVWVQEWCMFCTLNTGEYKRYLIEGITAMDEPMFWTYTLEDTNDRRFFLCGNIHQHPELITK